MKHASSQILSAHWNEKRCGPQIAERREIDPAALTGALGDVFILAFDPAERHPFRLAGTRMCSLFCRELRKSGFLDLWADETRPQIARLVELSADESVGIVAAVSGHAEYDARLDLELTLLPLRHHGRARSRLIGSLAPLRTPYWLGLHPLKSLTLGRYRYLGDDVGTPAPVFSPLRLAAAAPLRIYQGGRR